MRRSPFNRHSAALSPIRAACRWIAPPNPHSMSPTGTCYLTTAVSNRLAFLDGQGMRTGKTIGQDDGICQLDLIELSEVSVPQVSHSCLRFRSLA